MHVIAETFNRFCTCMYTIKLDISSVFLQIFDYFEVVRFVSSVFFDHLSDKEIAHTLDTFGEFLNLDLPFRRCHPHQPFGQVEAFSVP